MNTDNPDAKRLLHEHQVHQVELEMQNDELRKTIAERNEMADILLFMGQCGISESTEGFFHDLARYLARTLDMEFVCIDRLDQDHLSAETLAVFHNGQFEDNISYTLHDTPCGAVVGKRICSFPKNICGLFPNDTVLKDLQAESYLGATLWSSQGKPIGLIAVIGRKPLEDTRFGESVLQLVSVRASGELERLQAEEELRASEKRLALATSATQIGMFDQDLINGKVLWTQTHAVIFGYTPAPATTTEYDSNKWSERVHPDDLPHFIAEGQRCMMERKPVAVQYRIIWPDGSLHWVETKGIYLYDINGTATRMIGVAIDITERKQSETFRSMGQSMLQALSEDIDLKESIKRVFDIIKSATGADAVGIRLQDEDDFPYFYQEGFPEDFLLKENSLLVRTKDGGICRDECGNICLECTCGLVVTSKTDPSSPLFTKGGSSWTNDSFPFLHVPVEDDPRTNPRNECIHQGFASIALIPIRAKGRVIGLLQLNDRRKGCFTLEGIETLEKIAESIGESMLRKQAEEALRESEKRFRDIATASADWIWEVDSNVVFTFVSGKVKDVLGYDPDEILGRTPFDLMPPDEAERVHTEFLAIAAKREAFTDLPNLIKNRNGSLLHMLTSGVPIFDEHGEWCGYRGVDKDITMRKQDEEEIRRKNKELLALNEDMSFFNKAAVGRELRMIELKEEINKICLEAGLPQRYDVTITGDKP
jgi:PAS domain S-box-containing protein